MLEHLMDGYEQALDTSEEGVSMQKPDLAKIVVRGALKRTWKKLAKERIVNTRPNIPRGKNFWPLSKSEKNGITQLFEKREMLELVKNDPNPVDRVYQINFQIFPLSRYHKGASHERD